MLRVITLSLFAAASCFILISSSNGRAASFNDDRTGSPLSPGGGSTCGTCHGGGSFQAQLNFRIEDNKGVIVQSYKPDSVYTVKIDMSDFSSNATAFGFQAIALTSSNGMAGSFSNPNMATKISPVGSRQYIEHNGPSGTGMFEANWTAPNMGTGDVTFYAAGNATNGNGGSSGDNSATLTPVTLAEFSNASLQEDLSISLKAFPNPVSNQVTIAFDKILSEDALLQVSTITGEELPEYRKQVLAGSDSSTLDLSTLAPSTYLISLRANGEFKAIISIVKY